MRTPEKMILDSRKIFNPPPSNQNHRMLLKVVTFPRDISSHPSLGGQPYPSYLSKGGVGFLRGSKENPETNTFSLRALSQGRRFSSTNLGLSTSPKGLKNGGHQERWVLASR
jgi:hypothetical protein